jgi:hypothetical protein
VASHADEQETEQRRREHGHPARRRGAAVAYGLRDGQQHRRQAEADHGRHGDADLGHGDEVQALVGRGADAHGEQLAWPGAGEGGQLAAAAQGKEGDEQDGGREGHPPGADGDRREGFVLADQLDREPAGAPQDGGGGDLGEAAQVRGTV